MIAVWKIFVLLYAEHLTLFEYEKASYFISSAPDGLGIGCQRTRKEVSRAHAHEASDV